MADYGLTEYGVNIKRLDVILEEMQTELSAKWGVNTQQNPYSLLNILLTNVADQIAELWELGQDVYYSQYPATAEGMFLDNVGQFAGVSRETDAPSYYNILCTGTEGTMIPSDTIIASETNPVTNLYPTLENNTISRNTFNKAVIKVVSLDGNPLTVVLNGNVYSVTPTDDESAKEALARLADAISDNDFVGTIGENDGFLHITAISETSTNILVLSDNLTTSSVGSVFTFRTEEAGDIYLPAGSITEITKAVTGLASVVNVGSYIAGRITQTDVELRQSYMDKIFSHSERMGESIKSAILNNVQGISAIAVYENVSNETDSYGRYPHSVEVVVDGGDETEIALQILNTKAGGINTYGSQSITLTGENDEEIVVRFNRPEYLSTWFHVEVSVGKNATLPSDYIDTIKDVILAQVKALGCGDDIIPQNIFLPSIYENVAGIDYIAVTMATGSESPESYPSRNIYANLRQRCTTSENQIEVVISA